MTRMTWCSLVIALLLSTVVAFRMSAGAGADVARRAGGDPPPLATKSRMFVLKAASDFSTIKVDGFVPYAKGGGVLSVDSTKYPHKFAAAQTRFTGDAGTYNLTIETTVESDGESTYVLSVNGEEVGRMKNPEHEGDIRDHSFHAYYTWKDVELKKGDTIQVASNSHSNGKIPENGGFAWARGRWKSLLIIPANQ